jgi:hypothetical protein
MTEHDLTQEAASRKLTDVILDLIGRIPSTEEIPQDDTAARARQIAQHASIRAATAAGALALPPGPLGWFTILPELVTVWRIQTQMVADLAGLYGKSTSLSSSQMLYCIFRHGAAMAMRDIVVRVGDRYLFRRTTQQALQKVAQKIGLKLTQKSIASGLARWLPVIGALGVGGYAYYDTAQVAKTAMELFTNDMGLLEENHSEDSTHICDSSKE